MINDSIYKEKRKVEDLGKDIHDKPSSLNLILKGPNRGKRKQETDGSWVYITGYYYMDKNEIPAHYEWANKLMDLGHRVGNAYSGEVISFYIYIPNK